MFSAKATENGNRQCSVVLDPNPKPPPKITTHRSHRNKYVYHSSLRAAAAALCSITFTPFPPFQASVVVGVVIVFLRHTHSPRFHDAPAPACTFHVFSPYRQHDPPFLSSSLKISRTRAQNSISRISRQILDAQNVSNCASLRCLAPVTAPVCV